MRMLSSFILLLLLFVSVALAGERFLVKPSIEEWEDTAKRINATQGYPNPETRTQRFSKGQLKGSQRVLVIDENEQAVIQSGLTASEQAAILESSPGYTVTFAPSIKEEFPFQAMKRNIVFECDSITAGTYLNPADRLPQKVWEQLGAKKTDAFINLATNGAKVIDSESNMGVDNLNYVTGASKVLVWWCGTNDINGGDSVASVTMNYQNYIATRKAAVSGLKVVCVTPIARGGEAMTADMQMLGDNIRSYSGCDAIADPGALPEYNDYQDTSNTTYYDAVGIHPTALGISALIAPVIVDAIESLNQ